MKQKEIIEKLKEEYYIEYSEIQYFRRIFLYKKDGSNWVAQLNINSFNSLLDKNIIKLISSDNKPMLHPNRTIQRDIRKYILNDERR